MRFSNTFDVRLPPDRAWATLMDISAIAPCMPGAELTEKIDDRNYKGKVSVRLGPVALTFAGTARFEEINEAAHAAKVKAEGIDLKGRGGASALVSFRLEQKQGGSKVIIDTDLTLSGFVAQYGRGAGIIQSVAAALIDQFAKALEAQIAVSEQSAVLPTATADEGTSAVRAPRSASRPIDGFSLLVKALWASILGMLRRGR